jgi:hypothetical protein
MGALRQCDPAGRAPRPDLRVPSSPHFR